MRMTPVATRPAADPDALIREARRRQRIRSGLTAVACLAVLGSGTGLYLNISSCGALARRRVCCPSRRPGRTARRHAEPDRLRDALPRCRHPSTRLSFRPYTGYQACSMLRVLSLAHLPWSRSAQRARPAGCRRSSAWKPDLAVRLHDRRRSVVPSAHNNRGRLYVLRLTRAHRGRAAPSRRLPVQQIASPRSCCSTSPSGTSSGAPGSGTGTVRSSSVPCRQYTVLVAVPAADRRWQRSLAVDRGGV